MTWWKDNQANYSGDFSENAALAQYTYYRIGGPADLFAFPKTEADLQWLARGIQATGTPYFILGAGSNILVSDRGFRGLVIKVGRIDLGIEWIEPNQIRTGSGVAISTLLRKCAQEGWGGLEFLTGVPGSIGGVVVMNAGTHLGEAQGAVKSVDTLNMKTGERKSFSGEELKFQYRKNLFLPEHTVVLSAHWRVRKELPGTVRSKLDETLARRKATQPIDYPSCGSVFKNPKSSGKSAWEVVDSLGLRGHRIGNAQISEKHSNFIVNLGGAQASDVKGLIDLVKSRAVAEQGITLEEEVMYVGQFHG
jgi:UDP-N-acetylmuramate dehydrogenase